MTGERHMGHMRSCCELPDLADLAVMASTHFWQRHRCPQGTQTWLRSPSMQQRQQSSSNSGRALPLLLAMLATGASSEAGDVSGGGCVGGGCVGGGCVGGG